MQLVELRTGKKKGDVSSFNPFSIVKIQSAKKGAVTFIDLVEGPKFTAYTIYQSYTEVVREVNFGLAMK